MRHSPDLTNTEQKGRDSVPRVTGPRVPALDPSDPIHVIAPSGPVPATRLQKSLAQLRRRTAQIEVSAQTQERSGYFAGDDSRRRQALHHALLDPRPRTIWAARGGYGLTRLLDQLPKSLPTPPRVIGFSDISALLCALHRRYQLPSIHGPVLVQWAELSPSDQSRAWDMLCGEIPAPLEAQEGAALLGGQVEGPLIASNLELLRSLLGTPDFPDLRGCILALEDVGERPYRLDRSLTQLLQAGALRGVKGIALGSFHACEAPSPKLPEAPNPNQPDAQSVVLERLSTLRVPLLGGLPFGHVPGQNAALPFGTKVRLHVDHGLLEMLEPVFG